MKVNINKIIGGKYGKFTVVRRVEDYISLSGKSYKTRIECVCDCGNTKKVILSSLINGKSTNCGCVKIAPRNKVGNGMRHTSEYSSYAAMKRRCNSPKHDKYMHYGGRGIKVCDRWLHSFRNFFEDMGLKPDKTFSIERIDNNGNYEPSNCKWASKSEQIANKRSNKYKNYYTYNGETKTVREWAEFYNINVKSLWARLNILNKSFEDSINREYKYNKSGKYSKKQ